MSPTPRALWMILGLGLWACTSEDATGTGGLTLTVSGGEATRIGFPHLEGEVNHAFVDGWSLRFDAYVVVLGDVELSEPGGAVVGRLAGPAALDLAKEGGAAQTLGTLSDLPARRLDVAFSLTAATADAQGSADLEDLARMAAEGWSTLVRGRATRAGAQITFALGVAAPARYTRCTNGVDNTRGLVIENNKTAGAQISMHAVHLFWDRIGTDATLRFDPFAAMADAAGHLTAEALRGQDLDALVGPDGERLVDEAGDPLFFYDDVGNLERDERDLLAFLAEQIRLSAHLNGLGLCTYTRL